MTRISRIECMVWAVIFGTLATLIITNGAPQQPAGFLIIAAIGYLAGLGFLFLAMFGQRR